MTRRRKLVTTRKWRKRSKGGKRVNQSSPCWASDLGFAEGLGVVEVEIAGAEEPEAGVGAKEGEDADEQGRHGDEGPMQLRIMFGVEGIGVGDVFGEIGVGAGMTFLAGGNDVGLGEVGGGIGRGQDIVVAVAVVTGGDFGGDIGAAQSHGFAVVGFAVMSQAVLVAAAAPFIAAGLEVVAAGGLDLMGGMAVGADGAGRVAFGEDLAVDAGVVGLLDAEVAGAAGGGDVGMVDGGTAVNAALDVVDAVAVVAGGGDDQAHLQEGAAVDAFGVLGGDLGNFMRYSAFMPGLLWHLAQVRGRLSLKTGESECLTGSDVVGAVAIDAGGGGGGAHGLAHAVDAAGVEFGLGLVAGGALGRGQAAGMDHFLDGVVAIGAVEFGVDGFGEGVGGEKGHRHSFPVTLRVVVGSVWQSRQSWLDRGAAVSGPSRESQRTVARE